MNIFTQYVTDISNETMHTLRLGRLFILSIKSATAQHSKQLLDAIEIRAELSVANTVNSSNQTYFISRISAKSSHCRLPCPNTLCASTTWSM